MHIMESISERIDEELEDAKEYAKMALRNKEIYPEAYTVFMRLSKDEISHAQSLRDLAENMIAKNPNDEHIKDMYTIYNYLKGKQTEKMAEIKVMQSIQI